MGDGNLGREGKWLDQRNIECRSISIDALCTNDALSLDCPITGRENISPSIVGSGSWPSLLCGGRVSPIANTRKKKKFVGRFEDSRWLDSRWIEVVSSVGFLLNEGDDG